MYPQCYVTWTRGQPSRRPKGFQTRTQSSGHEFSFITSTPLLPRQPLEASQALPYELGLLHLIASPKAHLQAQPKRIPPRPASRYPTFTRRTRIPGRRRKLKNNDVKEDEAMSAPPRFISLTTGTRNHAPHNGFATTARHGCTLPRSRIFAIS